MRPCPTCQCFVPAAADHCPRCAADLEPVEPRAVPEERAAEGEGEGSHRELILVGAANIASPLVGSGDGDVVTRSVLARVALPPIDGPAGRPRRPTLPKLPQPFAPDPLDVAACLGIPILESVAPIEVDDEPTLAPDTFSALLGVPHEEVPPSKPEVAPAPKPAAPIATPLAAAPVATALRTEPLTVAVRASRFWRRDPFVRPATRKERILTRLCLLLVLALALSVVVMRLPLGPRPELDATALGSAVSTPVGTPVSTPPTTSRAVGARLQARADLRATLLAAATAYPTHRTYALATPAVLHHSIPELSFVTGRHASRRQGVVSVAGSAHRVVLAEYAGPGECAFARIVDRGGPESTVGPSGARCNAAAAPARGWSPMSAG